MLQSFNFSLTCYIAYEHCKSNQFLSCCGNLSFLGMDWIWIVSNYLVVWWNFKLLPLWCIAHLPGRSCGLLVWIRRHLGQECMICDTNYKEERPRRPLLKASYIIFHREHGNEQPQLNMYTLRRSCEHIYSLLLLTVSKTSTCRFRTGALNLVSGLKDSWHCPKSWDVRNQLNCDKPLWNMSRA